MMVALEARGFTLTYPGAVRPVFPPLSFQIEAGETVAVKGDSGAGKSSLLRSACGVVPGSLPARTRGELLLYGKPPAAYARAELAGLAGMVFQSPETQLFCGTVELEAAFGLENLCLPRDEMRERVHEILELVGMWDRRGASPSTLSGGQKQLLALAAVLAPRPKFLLLDETFSQLDAQAGERMMDVLRELRRSGQTMLFADHDDTRRAFADREICL